MALVKYRRTGMINAWRLIFVGEDFPAAFVDALLRHGRGITVQGGYWDGLRLKVVF